MQTLLVMALVLWFLFYWCLPRVLRTSRGRRVVGAAWVILLVTGLVSALTSSDGFEFDVELFAAPILLLAFALGELVRRGRRHQGPPASATHTFAGRSLRLSSGADWHASPAPGGEWIIHVNAQLRRRSFWRPRWGGPHHRVADRITLEVELPVSWRGPVLRTETGYHCVSVEVRESFPRSPFPSVPEWRRGEPYVVPYNLWVVYRGARHAFTGSLGVQVPLAARVAASAQ